MTLGKKTVSYAVLVLVTVTSLFPFYYVVNASVKPEQEYLEDKISPAASPTLENLRFVIVDARIYQYVINNLILVPTGLFFYIGVCTAAGFAFGKLRFRLRRLLFIATLFILIFPQMVLSVQIFRIINAMKLTSTYLGVIMVWVAYFSPFGTYMMTTYFSSVPNEIIESARMDGARIGAILARLMLPIALPMVATITIVGFNAMWNELGLTILILQNPAMRTMTQAVAMIQGEFGLPDNVIAAFVLCTAVFPILVFLVAERKMSLGAVAGAVKA